MPFHQQVITAETERARVARFLEACETLRPQASECTVDLEDAKILVHWPETQETISETYATDHFDVVALVAMHYLAADRPARLILLDVELPSLRWMLRTNLALPHLKKIIIRVFAAALKHDTADIGLAGGAPQLREVEIMENKAIDANGSEVWIRVTKLRAWVAHLGAPSAIVTYKDVSGNPKTIT